MYIIHDVSVVLREQYLSQMLHKNVAVDGMERIDAWEGHGKYAEVTL